MKYFNCWEDVEWRGYLLLPAFLWVCVTQWQVEGGMFVSGEIILFVIQQIKTNSHNSHLHQHFLIHSLFLSRALSQLDFRTFDSVILNSMSSVLSFRDLEREFWEDKKQNWNEFTW